MGIQISFSAAEKYILSPMQYFLHYLLKLRPTQLSSPLIFGNALDVGLNSLLKDKQYSKDCDLNRAKSDFETALTHPEFDSKIDYRKIGIVKFSKADLDSSLIEGVYVPDGHDPAWYSLREKGFIMLEAYYNQVLPRIHKVFAVQQEINLTNKAGDTFIGIVDFIAQMDDGKVYLMDNKSSSKKYGDDSIEQSAQLATYFEALKDNYNLYGVGYAVLLKSIRKKKEPRCEIQIQLGKVSEELIEETFLKYEEVLHGIKNGKFECTGDCCKEFWGCSYKNYCASGGTDLTGLEFKKK